jgi:hypothetical protein
MSDTNDRPELPLVDLHTVAGDRAEARAALDDFHSEFSSSTPDRAKLDEHAARVRAFADVAGPFERWWLDPRVQAFVAELNATGI